MMSSARLFSLDHTDRILYTVKTGRLSASRSLLSLLTRLLEHGGLLGKIVGDSLFETITGIEEDSEKESLPCVNQDDSEVWLRDMFPSN